MLKPAFIVMVLLVGSVLVGCAAPRASYVIPLPVIGATASYSGTDGSLFEVTIIGTDFRNDAFQRETDVIVLEYRLRPQKDPDVVITFKESIATGSGMNIRQDLVCQILCEPGFVRTFWGAQGLPGGLSMGPLWGQALPNEGSFTIETESLYGPLSLSYQVVRQGPCATLDGHAPVVVRHSWLPFTVLKGPWEICGGEIFPRSFVSDRSMPPMYSDMRYPVFTKLTEEKGDGAPLPWTGSRRDPDLPEPEWADPGPLSLLSDDSSVVGFPSMEAHEQAMSLDPEYRSFYTSRPGAAVVRAVFGAGGTYVSVSPLLSQDFQVWDLFMVDENGTGLSVTIRKVTRTWVTGEVTVEYENDSKRPTSIWKLDRPNALGIQPFVDARHAYRIGKDLFHGPISGATHTFLVDDGGLFRFPPVHLDDSYIVNGYWVPPTQEGNAIAPWIVSMDGRTGAMVHVQADASHAH